MSRRCLEPRWFVGDPTSLARDNILYIIGCQGRSISILGLALVYEPNSVLVLGRLQDRFAR